MTGWEVLGARGRAWEARLRRRWPVLLGVAAAALLIGGGVWRARVLRRDALDDALQRIATLADTKRLAIENWLAERRLAAAIVAEYAEPGQAREGRQWSAVQQLAGFRRLFVFDVNGAVTGRSQAGDSPSDRLWESARLTVRDGRARLDGPVRQADGALAVALVAPILEPAARTGVPRVLGAVLVTLDPADVLYPQLAHQPGANASGQCYAVARERDEVVLLSPRRYPAAEPLAERRAWGAATLLDRLAADGIRASGGFVDHGGTAVLAAARRVAGSPWGLVCRTDRWEALAAYHDRARGETVAALAVLLAAALAVRGSRRRADRDLARRTHEHAIQLGAAETRFKTLVEESLAGIYILRDGRFVYVNPTFARIFGYSQQEIQGREVLDLVAEEDQALVRESFERDNSQARSEHYTFRGRRKNGTLCDIEVHGVRVDLDGQPSILGTLLDVTERQALEVQLRQSQKMEAVGQLAGGMAHDFNNLLTSILATAELARSELPGDSTLIPEIEAIEHAGRRGAELTRKLLAFGRRQRLEFQTLDLGTLVRDFSRMMRRVVRENIDLKVDVPPEPLPVRADPGAVEQIVMNLVTNARDAMQLGGTLRIHVSRRALDAETCANLGWGRPDTYAVLAVVDSGAGMDEAVVQRVFEPFFTTKPVGMGTGLGMAMVYGLVKQHRGYVTVTSVPGAGTTVTVYLPLAAQEQVPAVARASRPSRGAGETILLVEDEQALLSIARRVLERNGYRVLTASDGQVALELAAAHPEPIDLLVTDVVMPRVGGPQLYDQLRREGLRPRVLFTSGYAERDIGETGMLDPRLPFLRKPWTIVELLERVREALDTPAPD